MAPPRVYRSGNLEIDEGGQCVRRDGETIHLRAQSFEALRFLIAHRGAIVSKEDLASSLWKDRAVTDNSIAQCVNDIRKALGDDRNQPRFLRTIPRKGYSFIAEVEGVEETVPAEPELAAPPVAEPPARRLPYLSITIAILAMGAVFTGLTMRPKRVRYGEIGWWKLDEGRGATVHDSSGHALPGSVQGTPRWTPSGARSLLSFEGVSTFVLGSGGLSFPRGGSPRTIAAWIRHDPPSVDDSIILRYGPNPSDDGTSFTLSIDPKGHLWAGSWYPYIKGRSVVADGQWHYVAGEYDSASIRLFVDGRDDGSSLHAPQADAAGKYGWTIGRGPTHGTPFRGAIRDVRLLGRALRIPELVALQRCTSGEPDVDLGEGSHYFLPVFEAGGTVVRAGSSEWWHSGHDLAGVQFARSDGACRVVTVEGEDVGQDLYMRADLLVPADGMHTVSAGPYFRSRKAAPGDGILGGTSAGFVVELDNTGTVKVRRLNPQAIVAFHAPTEKFDVTRYHTLEVEVRGDSVRVSLDGVPLSFRIGGTLVSAAPLRPEWERLSPPGKNEGAAGIAFLTDDRDQLGGQRVRNLVVKRL